VKKVALAVILVLLVFITLGCGNVSESNTDDLEVRWVLPPMVFVNDRIYQVFIPDIDYEQDEVWAYVGDIQSTVPGYEIPTENFQSNVEMMDAEIFHAIEGRIPVTSTVWGDSLNDIVVGDSIIVVFEETRYMFITDETRAKVNAITEDVVRSSLMIDGDIYSLMGSFSDNRSTLSGDYIFLGEVTSAVPLNEYPTENMQANREVVVGMKVYREPSDDDESVLVFHTMGAYNRYTLLPGAME
jgi:hypothetical protein